MVIIVVGGYKILGHLFGVGDSLLGTGSVSGVPFL